MSARLWLLAAATGDGQPILSSFMNFPPVYLAELLDTSSDEILSTDVFAKLELAVEAVYEHARTVPGLRQVSVEVSFDSDGEIEGVGIFDENEQPVAYITVYHLDRETAVATSLSIGRACRGDPSCLQAELNSTFNSGLHLQPASRLLPSK